MFLGQSGWGSFLIHFLKNCSISELNCHKSLINKAAMNKRLGVICARECNIFCVVLLRTPRAPHHQFLVFIRFHYEGLRFFCFRIVEADVGLLPWPRSIRAKIHFKFTILAFIFSAIGVRWPPPLLRWLPAASV